MTYRVVNFSTGEIVAEMGLSQFDIAVQLADKLAAEVGHREVLGVVEMVTRYETKLAEESNEDSERR
ncbi:hypothetical protein GA0061099_103012 [Bradyrhizobium yuanmingense]|uniref:Uncharacterized protein n=1 Tax=Bradyrhizobium yuanmingense TaxID=108015 RepID=A0A1C3XJ22_9BRAD|nr:hypothetical protein [Bradyrhizobium yuanmingense]TWI17763.1 hypothetical protein IQ15_07353 [Bradyrhizobium yuanmingense]SCB52260.1 hypothetical protein GA0061099_103012 [Bradyrhizobium yuanmingense]